MSTIFSSEYKRVKKVSESPILGIGFTEDDDTHEDDDIMSQESNTKPASNK